MANLYTAKFNINEKIYKVYEGEENLDNLLTLIFNGLNQDKRVRDEQDENIQYKFVDLHHDEKDMIVNGTVVKIYDGVNSTYNEKDDTVVDEEATNKADYVSFSFDVRKEIIGFVPKLTFSKESFLKYFTQLVEKCVPDVGVVVLILVTDAGLIEEKFKRMTILKELEVQIIPQNGDKQSFNDIIDILGDDVKNANAQRLGITLKGTIREPLVKGAKIVTELKGIALKGYAKLKAIGRDALGDDYIIDSEKDTLLKRRIRDDNRNSLTEIAELTKETAKVYTRQKAQEVLRNEKRKGTKG